MRSLFAFWIGGACARIVNLRSQVFLLGHKASDVTAAGLSEADITLLAIRPSTIIAAGEVEGTVR